LKYRIDQVLEEYYGANWMEDTSAQVILIAHSMGGLAIRQMLVESSSEFKKHINLIITENTPHEGTPFMNLAAGDLYAYSLLYWFPLMERWPSINSVGTVVFPQAINAFVVSTTFYWGLVIFTVADGVVSWFLNKYTDAGIDLGTFVTSGFQRKIKSAEDIEKQKGVPFQLISGRLGITSTYGKIIVGIGTAGTAISVAYNWENWPVVAGKLASFLFLCHYTHTSDLAVYDWSSDEFSNEIDYKSSPIPVYGEWHSSIKYKYDAILKAVEDPPQVYIDSAMVYAKDDSGQVIDSIVTIFQDGQIDTLSGKPSKIYGRIYDYFLAQARNKYYFCGISSFGDSIKYGKDTIRHTELGLNGNSFVIDSINPLWIFDGPNKITVKCKNIDGQETSFTRMFMINQNFNLDTIFPEIDCDISMDKPYSDGTIGSDSTIWSDSLHDTLTYSVVFTSGTVLQYFMTYFDDSIVDFIQVRDTTMKYTAYITNKPSEGQHNILMRVKVEGIIDTIKYTWNLYIDNTPPVINIIKPKSDRKYSPRVDSVLSISYTMRDDSMEQYFYQAKMVVIEIDTISGDSSVNVFRKTNDPDDNMFYSDYRLYKWNYRDNAGNIVHSGVYKLRIIVYDMAGNCGISEKDFIVDKDPPKLFVDVDEQLSPNPFTSNVNEMIMEYRTNEHSQFNVTYIDTSNISQERYRQFIGDSTFDSTCNWEHYYYFEGESTQGSYLPDGVYNIILKGIDDAGNDTTYNPNVFLSNSPCLRVDRTSPEIINPIIIPYIAPKRDTTVNLRFILSEKRDVIVNRGIDTVRIIVHNNSDTIYTNVITSNPDIADSINIPISVVSSNAYGIYTADIYAKDRFGNSNHRNAIFIYGTVGAKITSPEQGDTIPKGFKSIMGYAGDPDMYNYYDFTRYEIGYKKTGETQWQHNGIFVPEYRRGDSSYISILPANDTTVLAYWNTEGLTNGQYILNLKTFEETGNSLEYQHTVYIDTDILSTSPEIEYFNIEKIAGDTENRSRDDSIYNPANGDELEINYEIGKKISDVSIDISSNSFGNVYHKVINNVVPYKGEPLTSDQTGYYIYKENDLFYLKGYNRGNIGKMIDISIKSLIFGDSINLIEWEKIYNPNSPAGYRGSIDTPMVIIANIDNKLSAAGILPTKTGFVAKFSSNGNRYNISKGDNDSNVIYFGKDKVAFSGNVINLIENNREVWNLKKFGGANVHGGKYNIYISAVGTDGVGLADTTDFIIVRDSIEIQDVEITQSEVNPWAGIPAGLRFKLNEDGYVTVSVYKDTNKIATLLNGYFLTGNLMKDVSYYGNDSLMGGDNLYFKISATNPDSTRTVWENSANFSVSDIPANPDSGIYIPNNFFMGMIDNDSIFNGKGMYDFTSKYEAINNQPVLARGLLNIGLYKERNIIPHLKFYKDSVIIHQKELNILSLSYNFQDFNFEGSIVENPFNALIQGYIDNFSINKGINIDEDYWGYLLKIRLVKTVLSSVYNGDTFYCKQIYYIITDSLGTDTISSQVLKESGWFSNYSNLPTYSPLLSLEYYKCSYIEIISVLAYTYEDSFNLTFNDEKNINIAKIFPDSLYFKVNIDSVPFTFPMVEDNDTINANGLLINFVKNGNNTVLKFFPDTTRKYLWLDNSSYFIYKIFIEPSATVDISGYITGSPDNISFNSFSNDINYNIINTNIIFTKAISPSQFDYFLPDSIIKKDCIQAYSSDFSAYGDKIYYNDYYNENIEDSLLLHLHFNMKKKSSDYKLHLNEIWKSPESMISQFGIHKYRNYYQDTFLNNVIEPNTEYKFIKNVRIHGNGNLNDTLRGDGHGAYYSYS
ncbi:hypothetical protein KAU43_08880, partial [candidate division WOR-3 bacterium]|nr:hypothetical protein [candidate division WOR-3 bacterium]